MDLSYDEIKRLQYLLQDKIEKTQWVMENKPMPDDKKEALVMQVEFDNELMAKLNQEL